ncbi:MAG: beta-N-acetylhexosaminidase [Micavibrio aeruginosavorus]|uniref:beta-N-acetylhexosaminidase n=1 Tax=Micavibrio aeruginosavorus TaxID=349221 RepID=A0A7T5UHX5_9BACT|nr:MAG: beta-N-acetylhexosaminidase [Micavibrio aeruginosavorus]
MLEDAPPAAVIFGVEGQVLTKNEEDLFRQTDPLGFILFARNCDSPQQIRDLVLSLHQAVGRVVPVLIDQEGGRVQRMKPPHWKQYEPAKYFGDRFMSDFAKGRQLLQDQVKEIAGDLRSVGVNVNCAPVLDVLFPETHAVIGDRAFSSDPQVVAALGALACEFYARSGIIPVAKHIPGHGRAAADSHKNLPVVAAKQAELEQADFVPYRQLLTRDFSEAVWGMVAHVIYSDIDTKLPASCSRKVIWDTIRQDIGFKGFLVSDDIGMDALSAHGKPHRRAEDVLRGGCDAALHCSGKFDEIEDIAQRVQKMTNEAVKRYNRSISWYKGVV